MREFSLAIEFPRGWLLKHRVRDERLKQKACFSRLSENYAPISLCAVFYQNAEEKLACSVPKSPHGSTPCGHPTRSGIEVVCERDGHAQRLKSVTQRKLDQARRTHDGENSA